MSSPITNLTFVGGSPRSSGDIQTGEQQSTQGGGRAACIFSGAIAGGATGAPGAVRAGGSVLFYSGAGRLNTVSIHTNIVSGQSIIFYDSAIVALSGIQTDGTISASGMRIIHVTPPAWNPAASGVATVWSPAPSVVGVPFQSGLCALAVSGAPGFTVTYTPESNILDFGGNVVGA